MALSRDIFSVVCSFCDKPTLTTTCLISKEFCYEARGVLYRHISFSSLKEVESYLWCGGHHVYLLKHLFIYIPDTPPEDNSEWSHLFSVVRDNTQLISLKIALNPADMIPRPELQNLVHDILTMSSLEYVAITTRMVPAATALWYLALKELDMSGNWDESIFQDVPNRREDEKPKLNTLCTSYHDVSLQILQSVLNLSRLTRLAMVQRHSNTPGGMFLLLAESCPMLQELSIGVDRTPDKVFITKLGKLSFPHLQVLTVIHTYENEDEECWEVCELFVPLFLSVSPQLRELRAYLHRRKPSDILSSTCTYLSGLDGRIVVMRLYCWGSFENPPNSAEAEKLLRDQCGFNRDFEAYWMYNWADLTPFCELVDNE
ncbi:hypothetical protein DL96DRAFT_1720996 [Flagelloscypha sp. PMI_526]|nr:hypothetical protein DL96DRAFT_1720996 [Flagelloscypha sp. PMI_526]